MAKEIKYKEGQAKILAGVHKVAGAVKTTLGPKGGCVAIQGSFGSPEITRDGATVARSIELADSLENMGAQIIKKAASSTEEIVGDGTSSTCVLIEKMLEKGNEFLGDQSAINLNQVKSGMLDATKYAVGQIKNMAIQVDGDLEKIKKVATISANNDPAVGELIGEAMKAVGINGILTADISAGLETTIEVVDGMRLERGWASPHFVTSAESGKCVMEKPVILVASEKLSNVPQILPIIEPIVKSGQPLLIVCDDIDETVLTTLVMNVLQGALRCCVVKGLDYGEARQNLMEDLSIAVGARHICPEYGLKVSECGPEVLGSAERVVISKDSCVIYQGGGDKDDIQTRLDILRERLNEPGLSDYVRTKLTKRISGLSGGIGIIKAGGASDIEKSNQKATIEDAILASQSAVSEGVIPGGGYAFLKIMDKGTTEYIPNLQNTTDSYVCGAKIVFDSLAGIIETIAENAEESGDLIKQQILNSEELWYGWDAVTGEFGNLLDMGILDSAKALRVSLENATSAAAMLLLTKCTISDAPEKKEAE